MIVYQPSSAFLSTPWPDFVMAKVICRTQSNYTVALGLWLMLQKEYIQTGTPASPRPRRDLHPDRHPVHRDAAFLSGVHVRFCQG